MRCFVHDTYLNILTTYVNKCIDFIYGVFLYCKDIWSTSSSNIWQAGVHSVASIPLEDGYKRRNAYEEWVNDYFEY